MQGKTHELVGFGCGMAAVTFGGTAILGIEPTIANDLMIVGGSLVGSLLVDIDHTQSTMGRKAVFVSYPIYAINRFFNFISKHTKGTKKFWRYIADMFGHRGICHSGILWGVLGALAYFMMTGMWRILALGVVIGAFSHLIADTLNPSGIPWLLPFTKKRLSLMRISTGSGKENIFRGIVILLDLVVLGLFIMRRI